MCVSVDAGKTEEPPQLVTISESSDSDPDWDFFAEANRKRYQTDENRNLTGVFRRGADGLVMVPYQVIQPNEVVSNPEIYRGTIPFPLVRGFHDPVYCKCDYCKAHCMTPRAQDARARANSSQSSQ